MPIQQATSAIVIAASNLFEKERDTFGQALVAESTRPFGVHWARLVPALPTADYPLKATEPGREIERPQQRLARDKAHHCWHSEQMRQALIRPSLEAAITIAEVAC